MDRENEFATDLWRQQRRGTVGCGFLTLILASVSATLLFLFAPSWAFWIAVVPIGLFAVMMLISVVRELGRTSFFLHESTGEWRSGTPTRHSIAEIESVWQDLSGRHVTLVATVAQALARGVEQPHLLGDVVEAMEEGAESGEEGYWVCVNVLNHYNAELDNLRTLVRNLMPVEPPEEGVVEDMEQWLSAMIDDLEQLRRNRVFREQKSSFAQELTDVLAQHNPPSAIPERISRLRMEYGG